MKRGYVYYGNSRFKINEFLEPLPESNCYVFCEFNGTEGIIKMYNDVPHADAKIHRVLLGRVFYENNTYCIVQEHHGVIEFPHSKESLVSIIRDTILKLLGA